MTIIYSDTVIDIEGGTYIAPRYFDADKLEKCDKVYARDEEILNAYEDEGIEAISIEDANVAEFDREALKAEAAELGLEFPPNTPSKKLFELIELEKAK